MRRLRWAAFSAVLLTGCTQRELNLWADWYRKDPVAATEFAQKPEIQAELRAMAQEQEQKAHVTQVTHSSRPRGTVENLGDGLTNNHAAEWERIAWCESGRQWHLRATNSTGTYGGGLMIRDNVWAAYGGRQFAATADQASKAQQIEVAERILADVGWRAWDCA